MSSTTLEPRAVAVPSSAHSDDPIVLSSLTHDYGTRIALAVLTTDALGIPAEAKEAIAFAVASTFVALESL